VRILKNVNLNRVHFNFRYRVVGDEIVISQAPKYITESLAKTEMIEMGMIGTKHVPEELMLHDLSGMFEKYRGYDLRNN
jgi:hypothetical protein